MYDCAHAEVQIVWLGGEEISAYCHLAFLTDSGASNTIVSLLFQALCSVNPFLFTIATLTGHVIRSYKFYSVSSTHINYPPTQLDSVTSTL